MALIPLQPGQRAQEARGRRAVQRRAHLVDADLAYSAASTSRRRGRPAAGRRPRRGSPGWGAAPVGGRRVGADHRGGGRAVRARRRPAASRWVRGQMVAERGARAGAPRHTRGAAPGSARTAASSSASASRQQRQCRGWRPGQGPDGDRGRAGVGGAAVVAQVEPVGRRTQQRVGPLRVREAEPGQPQHPPPGRLHRRVQSDAARPPSASPAHAHELGEAGPATEARAQPGEASLKQKRAHDPGEPGRIRSARARPRRSGPRKAARPPRGSADRRQVPAGQRGVEVPSLGGQPLAVGLGHFRRRCLYRLLTRSRDSESLVRVPAGGGAASPGGSVVISSQGHGTRPGTHGEQGRPRSRLRLATSAWPNSSVAGLTWPPSVPPGAWAAEADPECRDPLRATASRSSSPATRGRPLSSYAPIAPPMSRRGTRAATAAGSRRTASARSSSNNRLDSTSWVPIRVECA